MIRSITEDRPKVWALGLLVATLVAAALLLAAKPAHADTFTVTNTADPGDGFCNAQGCTLREAIEVANAAQGADTIKFNVAGGGVKTISPESELPSITGPVTIDGYTQSGSSPNTLDKGTNAQIKIQLDGSLASVGDGLEIRAADVAVRGLAIERFPSHGIAVNSIPGGAAGPG